MHDHNRQRGISAASPDAQAERGTSGWTDAAAQDVEQTTRKLTRELNIRQIEFNLQAEQLRLTREQLDEERRRFKALYHSTSVAHLTFDRSGTVIETNTAGAAMLGMLMSEVIGRPFADFVHDDYLATWERFLVAAFSERGSTQCQLRFVGADRRFPVRIQTVCVDLYGGKGEACLVTATGISNESNVESETRLVGAEGEAAVGGVARSGEQQSRAEKALQYAQRMETIGALAGGVAHDFSSITAALRGGIDRARAELAPGDPAEAHLDTAAQCAELAGRIARSLLTFSRRAHDPCEVLCLATLCRESVLLFAHLLRPNVHLEWKVPEGSIKTCGDFLQLQRVMLNIVLNAAEAMPNGGTISISLSKVGDADRSTSPGIQSTAAYARLMIADTGEGMSCEVMQQAFEPYFTTRGHVSGTGLGLALANDIVRDHGGWIDVESNRGKGTVFYIYLPLLDEQKLDNSKTSAPRHPGVESARVLIVAEHGLQRALDATMLRDVGYVASQVGTVEEALATLRSKEPYRVIVVDGRVGDVDPWRCLENVREVVPDVAGVVISGRRSGKSPRNGNATGRNISLKRPFTAGMLAAAVRRAIEGG